MPALAQLIQQGNALLFVPSAILLGALHGLEPGHSKTMMAAFIVAVRGTLRQAVLLGLTATTSHTAVVWAVAMTGMYFGMRWNAESTEPYLQVVSGALILGIALWMLWRTWRNQQTERTHAHDEVKRISTGHSRMRLEMFEKNTPPRFRLFRDDAKEQEWHAYQVRLETTRPDGTQQTFTFLQRQDFLESVQEIPEPHTFIAHLRLGHEQHSHDYQLEFSEHGHSPAVDGGSAFATRQLANQDPHELAHANDIRRRFSNREVTTGQIVMFGLTGGLIPCPASITVLLLCLQLKEITLGAILVLCFSVGLALTLVISGGVAALSVKHVSRRWSRFGVFTQKAPYLSGLLIVLVGVYVGYQGLHALI